MKPRKVSLPSFLILFLLTFLFQGCAVEIQNHFSDVPEAYKKVIGLWQYDSYTIDISSKSVKTRTNFLNFLGTDNFEYWYKDNNDDFLAAYKFTGNFFVNEKDKSISADIKYMVSLDNSVKIPAEGVLLSMVFQCEDSKIIINGYNFSFIAPDGLSYDDSETCTTDEIYAESKSGTFDKSLLFPDAIDVILTGNLPENSEASGLIAFVQTASTITQTTDSYSISMNGGILSVGFTNALTNNTFSTTLYVNKDVIPEDSALKIDGIVYIDRDSNWEFDYDKMGLPKSDSYLFTFTDPDADAKEITAQDNSTTLITVGTPTTGNILDLLDFSESFLKLEDSFPSDTSTGIDINTDIVLTFSEEVDISTLDYQSTDTGCTGNIQISQDASSDCLGINSISSTDNITFTVKMNNPFAASKTYYINLFEGIESSNGNNLDKQYSISFTTN